MCGVIGFTGRSNIRLLKKMLRKVKHRGPDDYGNYSDDQVSLGMTRLAINDLRPGLYPLSSGDKRILLVFNGEIYNYLELKSQLSKKGVGLRTNCDAEVILPLYQSCGKRLVQHIEGMYAFALYDRQRKKLFLVRDRFGEKPLHYCFSGGELIFASELAALLAHPSVSKKINYQALYYFLRFGFTPTDCSIFADIHKLPPASWLEFDFKKNKLKIEKYWDLDFNSPDYQKSERAWIEELEKRILFSIKQQLRVDVPVGLFLSGGVDSGLVAAMSKKVGINLPVFSITIPELGYDESDKSEKLARYLNLKHFKTSFSSADLLRTFDEVAGFFDEPLSDPAALPTFVLAATAKRKAKIVLTGDGADELFGGYDRYLNRLKQQQRLAWVPKFLDWWSLSNKIKFPYNWLTWSSHLSTHYFPQQIFTQRKAYRLLNKEARKEISLPDPFIDLKTKFKDKPLNLMLYTDIKSLLANQYLVKIDKMTMARGLEARAPFLNKAVVELAAAIPPELKVKGASQEKYILRRLAERYLPSELAWQKKHGFRLPMDKWLRSSLTSLLDDLMSWTGKGRLPLNKEVIKKLVKEHRQGRNHGIRLWVLLSLKYWQENLE